MGLNVIKNLTNGGFMQGASSTILNTIVFNKVQSNNKTNKKKTKLKLLFSVYIYDKWYPKFCVNYYILSIEPCDFVSYQIFINLDTNRVQWLKIKNEFIGKWFAQST